MINEMKKTIEEEIKQYRQSPLIKELMLMYDENAKIVEEIDLIKFFYFEDDEICDRAKKDIEDFSKLFVPLFEFDEYVVGYWIHNNMKSINDTYIIEISEYIEIDFFANVTIFEYFTWSLHESSDIDYKEMQNKLLVDNITIGNQEELALKIKDSKILSIFKSTFQFLENIDELCKKGRAVEPKKIEISQQEYIEWMYPRYGDENPTKVTSKVWEYGVATKKGAYSLKSDFKVEPYEPENPAWCFDRFGKSITFLEDGTEIHIAGEHEDYYDPDFFIYNDVVVIHPDDSMDFYLYPKEIFIPTDFHTATLYNDTIVIIGNLGYGKNINYGYTQVYVLDIKSFQMTKIETTGDMPGWIHNHKATLNKENHSIVIEGGLRAVDAESSFLKNIDKWELNLKTKVWKKLTNIEARQLSFKRKDKNWHKLYDFYSYNTYHKEDSQELEKLEKKLGFKPEPEIYERLYDFELSDIEVIQKDDYDDIKIKVGDNILEIDESGREISVLVLGAISDTDLSIIKNTILKNLEALEHAEYMVEDVVIN